MNILDKETAFLFAFFVSKFKKRTSIKSNRSGLIWTLNIVSIRIVILHDLGLNGRRLRHVIIVMLVCKKCYYFVYGFLLPKLNPMFNIIFTDMPMFRHPKCYSKMWQNLKIPTFKNWNYGLLRMFSSLVTFVMTFENCLM